MKVNFDQFINESKANEFYVGAKVKIKSNLHLNNYYSKGVRIYNNIYKKIDTFATCTRIENGKWYRYFHFKLDNPITINNQKVTKIELESSQLRGVIIWDEKAEKHEKGELVKYSATPRFNWVLKGSKFKKTEEFVDVSDIDLIDDNSEMVSYIPIQKNKIDGKEKNRQQTKVGRILRKLSPDLSQAQLEEAILKFRALAESFFNPPNIKVVTGKDISYWYLSKNYEKGGGSLNSSCMRFSSNQIQVKFYDNFPDKIALAILVKNDKLWARALIWRLDDGRIYMDRIYSINSESTLQMKEYAKENGMLLYKNIGKRINATVTLKDGWFYIKGLALPYFDTAYTGLGFSHNYKQGTRTDLVLKF